MTKGSADKIEFLKKLLADKSEQELRSKELFEKIKQLKIETKDNPNLKNEVKKYKKKIKKVKKELKHSTKQIRWLSAQIGETGKLRWGVVILVVVLSTIFGLTAGYFISHGLSPFKVNQKSDVENIIICEFVYSGQPAGMGPTFEIGQPKQ